MSRWVKTVSWLTLTSLCLGMILHAHSPGRPRRPAERPTRRPPVITRISRRRTITQNTPRQTGTSST